jgi:rhodanese-related sulfurtransferase
MIINVEADELAMDIPFDDHLVIIDVRRETEFGDSHVADAINIPLSDLTDPANMGNIEDDQNLYIHCAVGYRSVIAASLFKRQGIHNLRNVAGGFEAIKLQPKIDIVKEDRVLN